MSNVTIVQGTPAIAATQTKVRVDLTLHQALVMAVYDGSVNESTSFGLYHALHSHPLYSKYRARLVWLRERRLSTHSFPDLTGEYA